MENSSKQSQNPNRTANRAHFDHHLTRRQPHFAISSLYGILPLYHFFFSFSRPASRALCLRTHTFAIQNKAISSVGAQPNSLFLISHYVPPFFCYIARLSGHILNRKRSACGGVTSCGATICPTSSPHCVPVTCHAFFPLFSPPTSLSPSSKLIRTFFVRFCIRSVRGSTT